ncbi:MAG TPA: hypothetical protein VM940_01390 [Chthoniobacterales bacterium]|nr:hypothetical protein [Chthoniobacterales bacterium]
MKRLLKLFVLTQPEQRVVIVLILFLVAIAWIKHHRDLEESVQPPPATSGATISTPPP